MDVILALTGVVIGFIIAHHFYRKASGQLLNETQKLRDIQKITIEETQKLRDLQIKIIEETQKLRDLHDITLKFLGSLTEDNVTPYLEKNEKDEWKLKRGVELKADTIRINLNASAKLENS